MAQIKKVLLSTSELLSDIYKGKFGTKNRAELISRVQGIELEAEKSMQEAFVAGQRDERGWKEKKPSTGKLPANQGTE